MRSIILYLANTAAMATATILLAGCSGDISKAKNKKLGDGPTYKVILEDKVGCKSVDWSTVSDKRDHKFVKASCLLDSKSGYQEAHKQGEEQHIAFAADQSKKDFESRVEFMEGNVAQIGNQLAMAAPENQDSYREAYEDLKLRLQRRVQKRAEVYAAIDASKELDLRALEERYGSGSKITADFIFIVGKESAQLDGLQMVVGGKTSDVPGFDVVTFLMAVAAGDKVAQARHWGGWMGSPMTSVENLTKLQIGFNSEER